MKKLYFILIIFLAACDLGPVREIYTPELPSLPAAWQEILGPPHWHMEWLNTDGKWSSWDGQHGFPALSFMQEWTTPVIAWPYWPEKDLYPRQMSPAGALFPWDVCEKRIVLSWTAGVDAYLWQELAKNVNTQQSSGTPRYAWYFDWPRFRELMESENIPAEVRQDPWLADWKDFAKRTTESGFDRRRIKVDTRTSLSVFPNPGNFWIGYSCFADPVAVPKDEPLILKVRDLPETWICSTGLLRCRSNTWIFIPSP